MKGKRSSNWKRILTGWISALLLFGTINDCPEIPPANPIGSAAQIVEAQEGLEGEPEIQVCGELEEEMTQKD